MDKNNMWLFRTLFTGLLIRKLCFLSFLFLSVNSIALDDNGVWRYSVHSNNETATINGCSNTCPADLIIPESIGGYSVISIDAWAFRDQQITNLTVPNSVSSIGMGAFYRNRLSSVTIPENVTRIEGWTFKENLLTDVYIQSGEIWIAASAFHGNPGYVSGSWKYILISGAAMIIDCSGPCSSELIFPESIDGISVTRINKSFYNMGIKSVINQSSLSTSDELYDLFGGYAEGVESDGFRYIAISDHAMITSTAELCEGGVLTIPESIDGLTVRAIGKDAFDGDSCPYQEVVIPNTIKYIGESSFWGNTLRTVTIPDSVTTIRAGAFAVNPLESLTLGNGLKDIGSYAFKSDLDNWGGTYTTALLNVHIPEGVTNIGAYAFYGNKLTDVIIPKGVISIGDKAFADNLLRTVHFLGDRPLINESNVFAEGSNQTLITYCGGTVGWTEAIFQLEGNISGATVVDCAGDLQFQNDNWVYILDGNNVSITRCFSACPHDLVIPEKINGYNVTSIGKRAFYGTNISSLIMPESLLHVGEQAFASNKLENIIIPNNMISIGRRAFADNILQNIEMPESLLHVGEQAVMSNQLVNVIIPNSLVTIGLEAFAQNQITSVSIPDSIKIISEGLFSDNKLITVFIPDSVGTIGARAFENNLLENITIPASINTIGARAFENNLLENITIPASINTIGARAFTKNELKTLSFLGNKPAFPVGSSFSNNFDLHTITFCDNRSPAGLALQ